MRFIWATAVKDLRRRLRDPMALLIWLGIPFVILALLSMVFRGGEISPQARLLVVDRDDSMVSGLLKGAFAQGELADLVLVEEVTEEEGRRRIDTGDGSALLIIPEEFGAAVLGSRPTRLTLLTNPSQSILPSILEEILSLLVDAVFYLQRLLGEPLAALAAGPPEGADRFSDPFIAATSVEINQLMGRVSDYLFPPRLNVSVEIDEPEEQQSLDLGALFFQSMFFLAILFAAQGMSDDVWVEERLGTLRRALTMPQGVGAFLAGKLLAGFLLMLAMAVAGISAGAAIYGFPAANVVPSALWAATAGMALLVLFLVLQLAATSQRAGSILSTMVLFPMMMLGGTFFPFEAMPAWLAAIGRRMPNGWALERFKELLSGAATGETMLPAIGAVLATLALGVWLAAWRLRNGFGR